MKILYLRDETKISEDIEKALRKLGHKVDGIKEFDEKEIIEKVAPSHFRRMEYGHPEDQDHYHRSYKYSDGSHQLFPNTIPN